MKKRAYVPGAKFARLSHQKKAAESKRPLGDDQITDLAIAFRIAFQQMLTGHASEANWATCVCSLNIALVLGEAGCMGNREAEFIAALEGAYRAKIRADDVGAWGFDGDAITAIKSAFEAHELQLVIAPRAQIVDAIREVHRRAVSGDVFS